MARIRPLALVVALLALAPGAARATTDAGTIDDTGDRVFWTGAPVTGSTAVVGVPEACAVQTCDEATFALDLPGGVWSEDGGVQVTIRWADENDDLDLFVYGPDGSLVAQSAASYSRGESVLIRDAANGTYRALVVPVVAEEVPYEGVVDVEFLPAVEPVRPMVPDLISLPARHLTIETSAYLFQLPVPSMPTGCYPEETVEQDAMRCLRFDQVIANLGDGPFEVRYHIDTVGTTNDLVQRIYNSDGTWTERHADTYTFHAAHAHFHYENFAQSHLYASNAAGDRGELVRSGRKNGFCMIDVEPAAFGEQGDAARTYVPPGCLLPTEADPETGAVSAISGISVGWADVYNWFLPDQFIEISRIPDGYYILENVADEADTVDELDETNNATSVHIRLCGDQAEIVGGPPACPPD